MFGPDVQLFVKATTYESAFLYWHDELNLPVKYSRRKKVGPIKKKNGQFEMKMDHRF